MKDKNIVQENFTPQRVSKVIARAGIASRREVERMIAQQRVKVNGILLERAAVNVMSTDHIEVDGVPLRKAERTRLWLYHKPIGLVTTHSDPDGRSTVFDNLPSIFSRVISVGRLDINTEGLLLLTNDGGLARVLELPSTQWLRVYRVRFHGQVDQDKLNLLKKGIVIQGICYGDMQVTLDTQKGSNAWVTVGLREGKNREIKKVFEFFNWKVNRLIRISYGPFQLGTLLAGSTREVSKKILREQLGPHLLEEAQVNLDAPIYSSETLVRDRPNIISEVPDDFTRMKKNSSQKNGLSKQKKLATPVHRRNLASNVWMAKGIHSSFLSDSGQREENHRRSPSFPSKRSLRRTSAKK
ncbi:MAG: pseudouridine synthase [Candidatus Liberibacter asiaticus]|uniref:Pseudouridine synthase n=2 Tax=Liberibacter asiaticus TaxID=34021 RepID=C6XHY6_LIBAP|nr:pseudouridine synthase [Candidatus Liberibacter asiaticus]ACT56879.1 putative ribosomal large subunit pseudouridine synthase B [Candidatus Liberibacter asiaticus str. psy62]AGH16643.1 putative ribosomal large subunit pseudouridine synthase B [Candidatus Liberibacter asiaticus str. gxpsy]BAP26164.1 ribosomal large subunit pseudouridine synthase B [Candidatus Liberibacter asiaticus str. Ishi-1]ALK07031.1 pseudouridine synthase [Candidatus Liberibacter asiaticus]ASK52501.1 pseudouridine syntha